MSLRVRYIFKWNALSDACPKCRSLNGREYRDQDIYQETLWDPWYGNIWDLNVDHSLTHPNCRCQLSTRVVISATKLQQELNSLLETLRNLRKEIERRY